MFYILLVISLLFVIFYYNKIKNEKDKDDITKLTNEWIYSVTVLKNPSEIANLFCNDAMLLGTVSQIIRKGNDIKKYFEYFAKLPNLHVNNKTFNIQKISDNVVVNNAWIEWKWDGLDQPVLARMTFIYLKNLLGDWCLFELHSSKLPEKSDDLLKISGKK